MHTMKIGIDGHIQIVVHECTTSLSTF